MGTRLWIGKWDEHGFNADCIGRPYHTCGDGSDAPLTHWIAAVQHHPQRRHPALAKEAVEMPNLYAAGYPKPGRDGAHSKGAKDR